MITPISSSFLKDLIGPPTFGDPTRRFPIVTIALPHKPQAGAIHFDLKSASKNIKLPTPSVWVLPQPPQNQDLSDNPEIWIYITSRPKRLMAVVFEAMDGRKKIKNDYRNYQGAWVHKTAQLDESIQLSPNVIVGAYVQIGRQTRLFPGFISITMLKLALIVLLNPTASLELPDSTTKFMIISAFTCLTWGM